MTDISIPEVPALPQTARFFREGGRDLIEIASIGCKDTIIRKAQPEHMAAFRAEWDAYCDGRPPERRAGTALTELAGIHADRVEAYLTRNVHTLEELAALSDAQCQQLGHGTLTDREQARKLVAQRRFEAKEQARAVVNAASAGIGPAPAESAVDRAELAELKAMLATLAKDVAALKKRAAPSPAQPARKPRPKKPAAVPLSVPE
jgi:hypothetical protein